MKLTIFRFTVPNRFRQLGVPLSALGFARENETSAENGDSAGNREQQQSVVINIYEHGPIVCQLTISRVAMSPFKKDGKTAYHPGFLLFEGRCQDSIIIRD